MPHSQDHAWKWREWIFALGLIATVFLAYAPAWHGGFLWDDDGHVTRADLRSNEGLGRIWAEPGATQQYYPVLHTAFWLEHRVFGDRPTGYHFVNLALHGLNVLLLLAVLRRLRLRGAWLAAGIFALHPVMVESVAWITELKNTLSGAFYFGAALAYLRFDAERRGRWYALALGLFILALGSKTVTATLPGALLVIFGWQRGALAWAFGDRVGARSVAFAGAALLLGLGILPCRQSRIYRDAETLYRATIARNPACWLAFSNLGMVVQQRRAYDEAITLYETALKLRPQDVTTYYNLGSALAVQRRLPAAVEALKTAVRLRPTDAKAHHNLGNALAELGRLAEAEIHFAAAVRLRPDFTAARRSLGFVQLDNGRPAEAARQLAELLKVNPRDAEVQAALEALAKAGYRAAL